MASLLYEVDVRSAWGLTYFATIQGVEACGRRVLQRGSCNVVGNFVPSDACGISHFTLGGIFRVVIPNVSYHAQIAPYIVISQREIAGIGVCVAIPLDDVTPGAVDAAADMLVDIVVATTGLRAGFDVVLIEHDTDARCVSREVFFQALSLHIDMEKVGIVGIHFCVDTDGNIGCLT